jgi:DNA-binding IclR family transcriptional regulator
LDLKTVRKALRLLESFSREVRSQGVTEVARKLNIHKSTAHALLTTLKEEGYVIFDPMSRKYFLGYKLIDLAGQVQYGKDLRDLARPVMERLAEAVEEDVALNVAIEGRRVCIGLVESRYFVRHLVPVGKALPLHCSAAGKVLLAYRPVAEVKEIVRKHGLPRFTENTITDEKRLLLELEGIRKKGYGESREEYGREAASLAFPVRDGKGRVIASLSIQSTVNRLKGRRRTAFVQEGIQAAQKMSNLLVELWP